MDNEYLDLVVQLENDLTEFYRKLGALNRLPAIRDAFSYRGDESARHSREISGKSGGRPKPRFNPGLVLEVVAKAKASLLTGVSREEEATAAVAQLAAMEENLGKLYQSMSEYLGGRYLNFAASMTSPLPLPSTEAT